MRSRCRVHEPDRPHIITSTVVGWLPIFASVPYCQILADSLAYCQQHKALKLHAWVIVENHFHAIVQAPELPAVMADLTKFTARRLIEQLPREERGWLLNLLEENRARHKMASRYQLWQEGFHPQDILDDVMMLQTLDYLHHNPVWRGWMASPEHWRYSSAHESLAGGTPLLHRNPWR